MSLSCGGFGPPLGPAANAWPSRRPQLGDQLLRRGRPLHRHPDVRPLGLCRIALLQLLGELIDEVGRVRRCALHQAVARFGVVRPQLIAERVDELQHVAGRLGVFRLQVHRHQRPVREVQGQRDRVQLIAQRGAGVQRRRRALEHLFDQLSRRRPHRLDNDDGGDVAVQVRRAQPVDQGTFRPLGGEHFLQHRLGGGRDRVVVHDADRQRPARQRRGHGVVSLALERRLRRALEERLLQQRFVQLVGDADDDAEGNGHFLVGRRVEQHQGLVHLARVEPQRRERLERLVHRQVGQLVRPEQLLGMKDDGAGEVVGDKGGVEVIGRIRRILVVRRVAARVRRPLAVFGDGGRRRRRRNHAGEEIQSDHQSAAGQQDHQCADGDCRKQLGSPGGGVREQRRHGGRGRRRRWCTRRGEAGGSRRCGRDRGGPYVRGDARRGRSRRRAGRHGRGRRSAFRGRRPGRARVQTAA